MLPGYFHYRPPPAQGILPVRMSKGPSDDDLFKITQTTVGYSCFSLIILAGRLSGVVAKVP
jgi:hypothetical protein